MKEAKRMPQKPPLPTKNYAKCYKCQKAVLSTGMHSSQITLLINCPNISKILHKRKKDTIQDFRLGEKTGLHAWKVEEKQLTFERCLSCLFVSGMAEPTEAVCVRK